MDGENDASDRKHVLVVLISSKRSPRNVSIQQLPQNMFDYIIEQILQVDVELKDLFCK